MWLMAVGLMLGGLVIVSLTSRRWSRARRTDFGWMSQQWLAEQRASDR
jgi:hypothetical protein